MRGGVEGSQTGQQGRRPPAFGRLMRVSTHGKAGACGWARSAPICISKHRRSVEGAPAPRFMAWLAAAAGTGKAPRAAERPELQTKDAPGAQVDGHRSGAQELRGRAMAVVSRQPDKWLLRRAAKTGRGLFAWLRGTPTHPSRHHPGGTMGGTLP